MTLVLARAASSARFAVEVMVSASSFIALMALIPSQLVPSATAPSNMITARILVMILTRASNDIEAPEFRPMGQPTASTAKQQAAGGGLIRVSERAAFQANK